jgi:hypothetical protein
MWAGSRKRETPELPLASTWQARTVHNDRQERYVSPLQYGYFSVELQK